MGCSPQGIPSMIEQSIMNKRPALISEEIVFPNGNTPWISASVMLYPDGMPSSVTFFTPYGLKTVLHKVVSQNS